MSEEFKIETVLENYAGKDSEVVIPEGVTKIGDAAFSGMQSLERLIIPDSVIEI